MLIKILIENHDDIILLEAEQDEQWETLEDAADVGSQGLFCGGLATCYAIIFQNNERTAITHASSIYDHNEILDMFDYVSNGNTLSCEITLARSPYGYLQQQAEDIKHGEKTQDIQEYFSQKDTFYVQFFREKFQITPKVVTMPHDFLMIKSNGEIRYFEEYAPSELSYEEILDNIMELAL